MVEGLSATVDANSLPDPNTGSTMGWTDSISLQPFDASRKVTSVYGEVQIPLVGSDQKIRGRIDDYNVVGNSSVPKLALSYEPFDDQFKLRGSLGKAFVAPTLYQLFGPSSTGSTIPLTFNNYGGGTTSQVEFNEVDESNRDLKPSTASTWTAGFVYAPSAIRGLSLSADFFETVQKNIVGDFNPTTIAQSVEQLGPASPYASYVHFGSPKGPIPTAPGQLSTAISSQVYIDLPYVNEASQAVKGIDSTIEYAFETASAGNFDLTSTWTIYNSYALQQLASEDYYQYAGHASVNQGTIPRFRSYTTLDWRKHGWGFDIAQTFIPSVTDIGQGGGAASPPVNVASYQQYDAAVFFKLSALNLNHWIDGLTIRVGVNNIFNKYPPLAPNAFPNTNADLSTYDGGIGRLFFVEGKYKFLVSREKFDVNY
jgi:iron complex outermembrane recepter protein